MTELLEPFAADLLPGALEAYALPVSDGSQRNRENMRPGDGAAGGGRAGRCRTAC